jgi:hypothetical protein
VESIEDITDEIEKNIKENLSIAKHINIETFADDIYRNWDKTSFDIIPKAVVSKVM